MCNHAWVIYEYPVPYNDMIYVCVKCDEKRVRSVRKER